MHTHTYPFIYILEMKSYKVFCRNVPAFDKSYYTIATGSAGLLPYFVIENKCITVIVQVI